MGCANKSLGLASEFFFVTSFGQFIAVWRQFEANQSISELSNSSYFQMLQSNPSDDWWDADSEKSLQ